MARKTWVQCPKTFKLIPKEDYESPAQAGFYVMGDIQPYQSMIDGSMIMGRRQHREHLRQHGCIEVGNEKITPKKPSMPSRESIRRDLHETFKQYGY